MQVARFISDVSMKMAAVVKIYSPVHWRGEMGMIIWRFSPGHPQGAQLVPHPALQPGAEVVDLSKGNLNFSGSGEQESGPPGPDSEGCGPRPRGKSENLRLPMDR